MSSRQHSLAPGLLGKGPGANALPALALAGPQRRDASAASLGEKLREAGIMLVTAELGRTSAGPVWVLTVKGPSEQLVTVNAAVRAHQDPHSVEAAEDVAARVTQYIARRTG